MNIPNSTSDNKKKHIYQALLFNPVILIFKFHLHFTIAQTVYFHSVKIWEIENIWLGKDINLSGVLTKTWSLTCVKIKYICSKTLKH